MMGQVFDKFLRSSEAKDYLQDRTSMGAGGCGLNCNHDNDLHVGI